MNSKFYLLFCSFLVSISSLFAQTVIVTGNVYDSRGSIAGATVMIKNTTEGNSTDMDGNYSIQANPNQTLVFSFVGYNTIEKNIGNQTHINVELKDDVKTIDEVVVTAIGIKQQKKKIGYTTQQINNEVLSATPSMNVGSALTEIGRASCRERVSQNV